MKIFADQEARKFLEALGDIFLKTNGINGLQSCVTLFSSIEDYVEPEEVVEEQPKKTRRS